MLPLWVNSSLPRLPLVVAGALGAAVLAQMTQSGLAIHDAMQPVPPASVRAGQTISGRTGLGTDISRIVAAHLFGAPEVEAASTAPVQAAPASWVLSGILQGGTPESGSAIIGQTATTTRFRRVGQELGNGFKLAQVLADQVIIEGNAQRLAVKMVRPQLVSRPLAHGDADNATRVASVSYNGMTPAVQALAKAAEVPRGATADVVAEGWKARLSMGSAALNLALRPRPHRDDKGHYDGIQITANGDADLQQMGLQPFDVITQVNGKPITSPIEQQTTLTQIANGAPLKLTVEHSGSTRQIALNTPPAEGT
jgi:type II secretory pathway component PulC